MKHILFATMMILGTTTAFAGCEDGDNLAESAVISVIKKQIPDYKKKCAFKTEYRDNTQTGEIYDVYMNCNGKERSFEVTLQEFEDAVCGNEKVKEL